MRRGFLTTSKAKKAIEKAVPDESASSKSKKITVETSHAPVAATGIPKGYTSSRSFQGYESNASTMDYDPDMYILTTVPSVERGSRLEDVPGGWAEALVSGHRQARNLQRTWFSSCSSFSYRTARLTVSVKLEKKGLGMFATRLIRAGDLIIDERPMFNAGSAYDPKTSLLDFTPEEQRRIVLHEQEKVVQMAFDRMPPENQKAFMTMANSHELDGSGPLVGRIRTNGFGCEGLRDKDATGRFGRYSAICKDTTRINHSCTPNTTRHWNTSSFSLRTYAVCDILPGTEITLAYCHPFRFCC
ncbi:hypothetical protein BT96DRAFT_1095462 [Gymnopus androsaceus JB14]|uniref:SET domain-containing protein n=1 Tax=Gymnopus androsaceus JB14 TaxID=1447944 RepID=A0A6A4IA38_9AGAR|nr:hypothetical protein BT96DRAFT_1095462 [Gymnopus androsaceus JB14]